MDFGVGQGAKCSADIHSPAGAGAKRAPQASAKINATLEGARQKGSWLRRSFVPARCGAAPHLLLAIRPSASTRDPLQYFNSLLRQLSLTSPKYLTDLWCMVRLSTVDAERRFTRALRSQGKAEMKS